MARVFKTSLVEAYAGHLADYLEMKGVKTKSVEEFFEALAETLKEVFRMRPESLLSDYGGKLHLLTQGVSPVYTLTKKNRYTGPMQELRAWVRMPNFGGHDAPRADGYGSGAIFEAVGDYNELRRLAELFLVGGRHCFEDESYVIWV